MTDVINNFKQELIAEIKRVYELEYPTASGAMDEFYHDVLNIIRNSGDDNCEGINDKLRLAMRAGAYLIRNKLNCSSRDGLFADPKTNQTISWSEAEKILLCTAEGINPDECEIKHE